MHDVGSFVGKKLPEPGYGEWIPRGRQRPADDPEEPVVPDFVTVSGELDDLMAVLPQQGPFRQIDRVFAARGDRAIEIVDEKDFHGALGVQLPSGKRTETVDHDRQGYLSSGGELPGQQRQHPVDYDPGGKRFVADR